ncbi:MAG: restriction endonuclease subunit S [Victivallaceae bacterium]|nr:restriction endonuclease subunit S [Victivallaceae bacterium]
MTATTEFKQTKIGPIPVDWEVVNLGDIGLLKNGLNKSKEDFGKGYPFVNLMNVFGYNTVNLANLGLVNSNKQEQQDFDLKIGDVLFIRSSVKPEGVGLTAVILNEIDKLTYSGFLIRFRPASSINNEYKKYCFYEDQFRYRLLSKSTVSANTNINQPALASLLLPLPPLPEQKKIAEVLSTVDDKIDSIEQEVAQNRTLKKGLMQKLLTGQLSVTGTPHTFKESKLGPIPESWDVVTLGNASAINSSSLNNSTNPNYEFHYIDLSSVREGNINVPDNKILFSDSPSRARRKIEGFDVLMATVRPNLRGFALVNFDPKDKICSTGFAVIRANQVVSNPGYLYQNLYSKNIEVQIEALIVGSNYPAINSTDVEHLTIPLPPLPEQEKIAEILNGVDDKLDVLEEKKNKYTTLKKGLMQKLLTGKIRVEV